MSATLASRFLSTPAQPIESNPCPRPTKRRASSPPAFRARKKQALSTENFLLHATPDTRAVLLLATIRALALRGTSLSALERAMLACSRALAVEVTLVRDGRALTCYVGARTGRRRYIRVRARSGLGARSMTLMRRVTGAPSWPVVQIQRSVIRQTHTPETAVRNILLAGLVAAIASVFLSGSTVVRDMFVAFVALIALGSVHCVISRLNPVGARFLELSWTTLSILLAHASHISSPFVLSLLPGFLFLCALSYSSQAPAGQPCLMLAFVAVYTLALRLGLPLLLDAFLMSRIFTLVLLARRSVAGADNAADAWLSFMDI